MRISSNTIYLTGTFGIQQNQSQLASLQEQLSTMKRVNRPSDDPVAAAQVLDLTQSSARNDQMVANTQTVESRLALSDSALQQVSDVLQSMKELAVQAGNASLDSNQLSMIRVQFRSNVSQLVGLANSTDGTGKYLFAGSKSDTKPFDLNMNTTPMSFAYNGDFGQTDIQVSASRQLSISDPGEVVFGSTTGGAPNNNLFQAMQSLDTLLNNPASPTFSTDLQTAMQGLDTGLQQVLRSQAQIGSRRAEADALGSGGQDLKIQYASSISTLQDLDIPQAVSNFQLTQQALTASQKTFQQVSKLTLFDLI